MTFVSNLRGRVLAAAVALAACSALLFVGAAPANAANGFTCRAEALNLSLFGQQTLRPLVAGSTTAVCDGDKDGAPEAGQSLLPDLLGLDGAYARTDVQSAPNVAPAYQVVRAESGVADARLDPTGSILRAEAVKAISTAKCVNGKISYSSQGTVANLYLFGQKIDLNGPLTQIITGLDGITQVLVHITLNEVTEDSSGYRFRALRVQVPQDGSVADVVVAENRLNGLGTPCSDFTGGPGPNLPEAPNDKPIVGLPYGGGNVVKLGDVAGYNQFRKISLCATSRAYGRRIAIVGNNKRNTITGSKFADRIFAYGARDRLNGGSGNDCVEAGNGSDIVNGGTGHDALYGRAGRDYLDAGAGRDRVWGGSGVDTIVTGSGRDRIDGGTGNDKLFTRDGRDVVKGGAGNDKIFAAARGRRDRISCGKGRDVARVDRYDRVSSDCETVLIQPGRRIR
jgi:hypothetical protein